MPKFNTTGAKTASPKSPVRTVGTGTTHEGQPGFVRDAKGELFRLATTNMVGEDTFYEKAADRDARYRSLVQQIAIEDPTWLLRLVHWLRTKANMRTASVVLAVEAVRARTENKLYEALPVTEDDLRDPDSAALLAKLGDGFGPEAYLTAGLARLDEVGEAMAYWNSRFGRTKPKAFKRGVEERVVALASEYSYAKYGAPVEKNRWHLADAIDLLHPKAKADWQGRLFQFALEERHNRKTQPGELLPMLTKRREITRMDEKAVRALLSRPGAAEELRAAGLTWEALTGVLKGELDAKFWESIIPSMGIMALLRNLANFERAGISREARVYVVNQLVNPEVIAKSRQFPYRFLSAYRALQGDHYTGAVSEALDLAVGNLPRIPGRTLILADTSGSMQNQVSYKSVVRHVDIAALFAVAVANTAQRNGDQVDFYGFASGVFKHEIPKGQSILRGIEAFDLRIGEVGHGTEMVAAIRATLRGHDRVVLISDEQAHRDYYGGQGVEDVVGDAELYVINTSGTKVSVQDTRKANRHDIAGFSDQVFRQLSLDILGKGGQWPF